MATEPILAVLDLAEVRRGHGVRFGTWSDYWALTKPEVNFLIAIATGAAFCLASPRTFAHFPWITLLHTLLGTILVASGAGSLNQVIERNFDAQMRRTARRPIADGRIATSYALAFGIVLSLAGSLYLALAVRPAASLLALATLAGYLLLYTPLKRLTPMCTLVGAFPGAMPVLIGYAAAMGKLNAQAWLLYAVLFLWQFPHLMAIAWMYREDYARAGYLVLPAGESSGRFMNWLTVVPALAPRWLCSRSLLALHCPAVQVSLTPWEACSSLGFLPTLQRNWPLVDPGARRGVYFLHRSSTFL